MSGHKIGALTGAGFVLAKDTTTLEPLIIGGGQERNLRGGTQNYIGNETLAVALDYFQRNQDKLKKLFEKRKEFENKVKEKFPEVVILGENAPRLASSTYIALPGVHGQAVQIELESKDIFVTTSSACSDNEPVTSKVLQSMGVDDHIGRGVVRISLGLCSGPELYDEIADALIATYSKLQQIKSF
jgi:cysteine desulfurase